LKRVFFTYFFVFILLQMFYTSRTRFYFSRCSVPINVTYDYRRWIRTFSLLLYLLTTITVQSGSNAKKGVDFYVAKWMLFYSSAVFFINEREYRHCFVTIFLHSSIYMCFIFIVDLKARLQQFVIHSLAVFMVKKSSLKVMIQSCFLNSNKGRVLSLLHSQLTRCRTVDSCRSQQQQHELAYGL
jgi:hypothetical protein